jgi:aspartyl protease family protein
MAFSPTVRHAASLAGTWLFIAASLVLTLVYYQDLKPYVYRFVGMPTPEEIAAMERQAAATLPQPASGTVEIRAGSNGHFFARADINGREVDVLVDTGASLIALTYEDAVHAGLYTRKSDFTHRVKTANGVARVAPVTLASVSIGDITVRNVRGVISEPGKLDKTLLGMTFLSRLSRTEIRRGTLILEE